MRKLVSLGLLALIFSVLSSSALAGNVEACNILKDKNATDYVPGLYGLCVAWHNANDKHKDKIAAKFEDRAGYPLSDITDPGQDLFCPCWDTISFSDICSLGAPSGMFISDFFNFVYWGDFNNPDEKFSADITGCGYAGTLALDIDLIAPDEFFDPETEVPQCISEAVAISAMYNGNSCD